MAQLGINYYNSTDPSDEFFKSFATYFNLIMAFIFCVMSSGAFIYLNWPDLEVVLEPFFIAMGGLQCGGMLLSVGLNMRKVKLLHFNLQQIVDEGNFSS